MRSYTDLSDEDIKALEEAYTSDPRPMTQICEEMNIAYTSWTYVREKCFPEAKMCKKTKTQKESKEQTLERWGMTMDEIEAIKDKYINTMLSDAQICQEAGITMQRFNKIHEKFFPEWTRGKYGRDKAYKIEPKRSHSQETEFWLKTHWNWRSPKEQKEKLKKEREANSKYRVVYKGQTGHLRTPYRPDGKFK